MRFLSSASLRSTSLQWACVLWSCSTAWHPRRAHNRTLPWKLRTPPPFPDSFCIPSHSCLHRTREAPLHVSNFYCPGSGLLLDHGLTLENVSLCLQQHILLLQSSVWVWSVTMSLPCLPREPLQDVKPTRISKHRHPESGEHL